MSIRCSTLEPESCQDVPAADGFSSPYFAAFVTQEPTWSGINGGQRQQRRNKRPVDPNGVCESDADPRVQLARNPEYSNERDLSAGLSFPAFLKHGPLNGPEQKNLQLCCTPVANANVLQPSPVQCHPEQLFAMSTAAQSHSEVHTEKSLLAQTATLAASKEKNVDGAAALKKARQNKHTKKKREDRAALAEESSSQKRLIIQKQEQIDALILLQQEQDKNMQMQDTAMREMRAETLATQELFRQRDRELRKVALIDTTFKRQLRLSVHSKNEQRRSTIRSLFTTEQ